MKKKVICRFPGYWIAIGENDECVNEIQKQHNGWKLSRGYYRNCVFNTLEEARDVAFY